MSYRLTKASDIVKKGTNSDHLKIFITSWNMGNAEPQGMEAIFGSQKEIEKFDIIAIGLQESTYSLKNDKDSNNDCIVQLFSKIKEMLGIHYYAVSHCHRAQLQLFLFAKNALKHRVTNIEQCAENTGFLHVFPNKGGLLVTFTVDGTKLAFVSCHLTAHEGVKHCEQRNCSIVEILGGARAGDTRIDITEQFHHVFWMGDMNYRLTFDAATPANTKKNIEMLNNAVGNLDVKDINVDMDALKGVGNDDESDDEDEDGHLSKKAERRENMKRILDMVVAEQWEQLLDLDELNREMKAGRVLNDFHALQPHFPPTFKRERAISIPFIPAAGSGSSSSSSLTKSLKPAASLRGVSHVAKNVDSFVSAPGRWLIRRIDTTGSSDTVMASLASQQLQQSEGRIVSDYYNHKRLPSFTDRILYKSMKTFKGTVTPEFFDSVEGALSSDHKPVKAGFDLSLSKGREDIFVNKDVIAVKKNQKVGSKLRLTINELRGENLEEMDNPLFGGGSDPYIIITTDPPSLLLKKERISNHFDGVKSSVIKHNLNPVWEDSLQVTLASIDLEGLARNATLIFSVWDEDLYNAHDLIGVITIPMRDVLLEIVSGKSFLFGDYLRSNSEIMGKLSGRISLDGSFTDIEYACQQLAAERGRATAYLSLSQAELEQANLKDTGCNCTVN